MARAMPYPELQSMFDALCYSPGLQWYWKADFVNEVGDRAIDLHLVFGTDLPTELCAMHLYPINRAVHEVDRSDTAFSFRDVTFSRVIVGVDSDPTNVEHVSRWVKDYWKALHPLSAAGGYVNFMMEEGQ